MLKLWALSGVFIAGLAYARDIPPLTGPVLDEVGWLSVRERHALEEELRVYPPQVQLQIWLVPSLEGEPIESLSIRAVEQWKLGDQKSDRGVLILVASEDRAVRIEVGQGLEGDLPDALAGRIVDRILLPSFRAGRYAEGLRLASRAVYERAGGNLEEIQKKYGRAQGRSSLLGWGAAEWVIFILFILIFAVLPRRAYSRRRGPWGGGGMWGGGGFGGGGFGGGGWSGGGGGFSGGGASGRW